MRSTHNLKKTSSWFWRLLSKSADLSKPWGRFFQILCVSQKVRTLLMYIKISSRSFTLVEFFVKTPWYSEDLAHASENLSIFGHSWPIRCLWWMSISRKSFKNCYFLWKKMCMCLSCGAQHLLLIIMEPKSCWIFFLPKRSFF